MKVKVGDTWYDGKKQPVMVELTDKDKENICEMPETSSKYCQYPAGWERKIADWMGR